MSYRDWPWHSVTGRDGQTYTTSEHPKVCLHTTETQGLPNYTWPPHITYDIDNDRGWWHVPADKGSYALRSPGGGRSPNYQAGPVFQIEVVSYAKDSPNKTDDWYERLSGLVSDVCADLGVPPVLHPKGFIGSEAYGIDGPNRLTWDEYRLYSGVLGHQHVPANTHWDPGNLDESRLEIDMGMRLTEEDADLVVDRLMDRKIWYTGHGSDPNENPTSFEKIVSRDYRHLTELTVAHRAGTLGTTAMADIDDEDLQEIADAVNDELRRRLAD